MHSDADLCIWAHPRSRGENISEDHGRRIAQGSSPLTRGKRNRPKSADQRPGLIPAHAGKTSPPSWRTTGRWAHPRSRGENPRRAAAARSKSGSSPLTRGNPPYRSGRGAFPGSSPLTRGKRTSLYRTRTHSGLIPAHAGKTCLSYPVMFSRWAHPRSRGENGAFPGVPPGRRGSSPLTRGKHFPTCAFTAQIDQILETLELAVSSGSYSVWVACATDAPQDQVRSIGLVLPSSRGAS